MCDDWCRRCDRLRWRSDSCPLARIWRGFRYICRLRRVVARGHHHHPNYSSPRGVCAYASLCQLVSRYSLSLSLSLSPLVARERAAMPRCAQIARVGGGNGSGGDGARRRRPQLDERLGPESRRRRDVAVGAAPSTPSPSVTEYVLTDNRWAHLAMLSMLALHCRPEFLL